MEPNSVPIREFYKNFTPPHWVYATVVRIMNSVPDKHLCGLDCVVLTNQSAKARRDRLGKVTSRGRRHPQSRVLGRYHPAHRGNKPWIELYVDNVCAQIPKRYNWIPILRETIIGKPLFHEIGHHIHRSKPEHREKEDVADDWALKLGRNFVQKRYWYLRPIRKQVAWAARLASRFF